MWGVVKGNDGLGGRLRADNVFVSEESMDHDESDLGLNSFFFAT